MSDEPHLPLQAVRMDDGTADGALLRAALDAVPDAVYVRDVNGRYLFSNAAAQRVFGGAAEAGHAAVDVLPTHDADGVQQLDGRVMEGATEESLEEELSVDGERRVFATTRRPVVDANGRVIGVLAVARDVTANKRLLDELELRSVDAEAAKARADRAEQQAQEASRARSEFLATMSHELRTPLNVITGYADLLQLAVHDEAQRHAHLDRIKASAWHLLSIIEEILSFSRLEGGRETVNPEVFDAGELAAETVSIVQPLAQQKQLTLELRLGAPTFQMETDRSKMRQILVNLLSNALKFTERGGIIVEGERTAERVVFRVRDTGPGIDPAHVEQIFDPFWQVDRGTHRRSGGTGLGLAVSRQLALLLGGELTVQSELGVGSTFTVAVPFKAPE